MSPSTDMRMTHLTPSEKEILYTILKATGVEAMQEILGQNFGRGSDEL
jgi:hypothetical protein